MSKINREAFLTYDDGNGKEQNFYLPTENELKEILNTGSTKLGPIKEAQLFVSEALGLHKKAKKNGNELTTDDELEQFVKQETDRIIINRYEDGQRMCLIPKQRYYRLLSGYRLCKQIQRTPMEAKDFYNFIKSDKFINELKDGLIIFLEEKGMLINEIVLE